MIEVGKYALIGSSCLAMVRKIDATGFDFDCTNGAWSGRYDTDRQAVFVTANKQWHDAPITSTVQPPDEIRHDGYNTIIPWMQEHTS